MSKKQEVPQVSYIAEIKRIIAEARAKSYSAINYAMVEAYWLIGKRIVEEEQQGKVRAEYGKEIIKTLSAELTNEYGKGFSATNITNFKKFYLTFSDFSIYQALPDKSSTQIAQAAPDKLDVAIQSPKRLGILSWTHYERLIRVSDSKARLWYMKEAEEQMWGYRTLDRNISTMYYQRILASQQKEPVVSEMREKTADFQKDRLAFIKNPTVLEFLGLPNNAAYTETELEKAIIDHMQQFLLELGKGFAFVARQQLVRSETSDFYIDLVFYNYILKCFVIIELKAHPITHQDIGQLDMYVRLYDDMHKTDGDNQTIGILLCTETDKTIAKYSVLNENKLLFAAKYMPYLPTEKELAEEIERQKELFKLQHGGQNE